MSASDAIAARGSIRAETRTNVLWLLSGIIGLAIVLRAIHMGALSLWNDELFSRYYADLFGVKYLWTTGLARESSPPLYYMAIEGWMRLFGSSEVAMRSLSAVASVLTVPLVYAIGKELFDSKSALLAALVFALSPMQVAYAQEARTYALLSLPVCAVLWSSARFMRGDMRGRVLLAYGLGAVIALYCHATAAFFLAACNLVMIAWLLTAHGERRTAIPRWLGVNIIVAVLAIPELQAMLAQGRTATGLAWIAPFRPGAVIHMLTTLVTGHATPYAFPGVELALALLACLGLCLLAIRPHRRAVALSMIPVLFVVLMAGASFVHPIFLDRVFLWLGIPLAIALGAALAVQTRLRPLLLTLAVLASGVGLGYRYIAGCHEPWSALVQRIGTDLAGADHVVVAPLTGPPGLAYYDPELPRLEMWSTGQTDTVEHDDMPRRMGVKLITRDQLLREIRSGQHVWLVMRKPDQARVDQLIADGVPPKSYIAFACHGVMCLMALTW